MWILGTLLSVLLILVVLGDAFEAMVLPRRVTHSYRLARLFFGHTWRVWRLLSRCLSPGRSRESWLSLFGRPRHDTPAPQARSAGGAQPALEIHEDPQTEDTEDLEIPSFLRRLAN